MAITASYSGSSVTFPNRLIKSPFGFNESNTRRGRTAEILSIEGLLLRSEASSLVALFNLYRAAKITEEDPQKTGALGATVAVTGSGTGFSWTNRACWIDKAPSIVHAGAFVKVSVDFVDATQALEVLLQERDDADEDGMNLGTETLGSAVINLLAYPKSYEELPQISRNPAGVNVITGQLTLQEIKQIEGWVTEANKNNLESWLNTTIATTPAVNSWYPVEFQRPVAKTRFGNTTYDVNLKLIKIK